MAWQKLGSTKLTSTGDTITVSGMTAKKHLKIIYHLIGHTDVSNFDAGMQFNSDTGSNYAWRESSNGASDSTSTSTTRFMTGAGYIGSGEVVQGVYNITNIASEEKLGIGEINESNASGAGNAPNRRETVGKWANTSNQITSIQIIKHSGTGNFAVDSEVTVYGTD